MRSRRHLPVTGQHSLLGYASPSCEPAKSRIALKTTREALGAQRRSIYTLILRQAGGLIAAGLVIGIGCAAGSSIFISKLLFGVKAWDFTTLAGVIALLGLASALASFLPARRAASMNPGKALRAE